MGVLTNRKTHRQTHTQTQTTVADPGFSIRGGAKFAIFSVRGVGGFGDAVTKLLESVICFPIRGGGAHRERPIIELPLDETHFIPSTDDERGINHTIAPLPSPKIPIS